jgi:hypothetical protein
MAHGRADRPGGGPRRCQRGDCLRGRAGFGGSARVSKKTLHQGEVQTHAHAVLVAFTVKGGRREETALIEIHIQGKRALRL